MRNYAVEMRELIDKETDSGPYEPSAVAHRIVEKLKESDPDLLLGFLTAHAVQILRETINKRDHSRRMMARKEIGPEKMQRIMSGIESGEITEMEQVRDRWLNCTFTLSDGSRHQLRTMRRGDLNYVAEEYGRRAAENAIEEKFMRLLARKVGLKTVGDVLTEEQIIGIRAGLAKFK